MVLSYVQTDATTPNIVESCCVRLHGAKRLTRFKNFAQQLPKIRKNKQQGV